MTDPLGQEIAVKPNVVSPSYSQPSGSLQLSQGTEVMGGFALLRIIYSFYQCLLVLRNTGKHNNK